MMSKYTSIWFDLDNTILDFSKSSYEAFHLLLREITGESSDEIYQVYKKINKQVWKDLEDGKINQTTLRSLRWSLFFEKEGILFDPALANKKYLDYLMVTDYLVDGALDVLNRIKSNYQLILVTNGLKEVQRARIQHHQLKDYFEHVVISDELGVAKPNIKFFEHTMKLAGPLNKAEILMVGDTLGSDIKGANHYQIDSCWLSQDSSSSHDANPTFTIKHISELLALLDIN